MLTRSKALKNAAENTTAICESAQTSSSENSEPSATVEKDKELDVSNASSSSPSLSPPLQEYIEPPWTENDKLKLKALKKIYQKSNTSAWTCDWKQIAWEMNRRPGDCLRQHCSFAQNPWSCEEDILLLETMDSGELDASKITNKLYPSSPWKMKRVQDRILLLQRHQLHTMALYQGLRTDDNGGSSDLVQILDKLHISDTADQDNTQENNPMEKALEDIMNELDRQKERIRTINKEWCSKCAYTMVERDYGIYHTYYKHDDALKMAIVNGKTEPTLETILPKVIDAYARSNDICCYCGRTMTFTESTSTEEQAPTTASADHFIPRKMAFNSDTHLHFTCRQCNYAKSNATDALFKSYLQDIKAFYLTSDKLFTDHIPLDDENRRQAWLTWKKFRKTRRKEKASNLADDISQHLELTDSTKIPPETEMDADDLLYMEMVDAMGLRDPMTGAVGVFDSTMKKSDRFIITFWDWTRISSDGVAQDKKIITGFDIQQFTSLNIQIIMKFTKDAQATFGSIKHFYNWLEAVQGLASA
ncbi:hypothetical protein BCR42DRAFT_453840 [Absidia repens]|uniref:Myb-like domain-containing protein n=1 Tax=Absidia repens TaxID=90262 RepID=A0A1X2I8U6_9FUNG|nr:hypothetical protein BCR42DRAFT_453840 [Absidia repens]